MELILYGVDKFIKTNDFKLNKITQYYSFLCLVIHGAFPVHIQEEKLHDTYFAWHTSPYCALCWYSSPEPLVMSLGLITCNEHGPDPFVS